MDADHAAEWEADARQQAMEEEYLDETFGPPAYRLSDEDLPARQRTLPAVVEDAEQLKLWAGGTE